MPDCQAEHKPCVHQRRFAGMLCKSCALISERGHWEPPSYQNAHRDEWLFLRSIARAQNPDMPASVDGFYVTITESDQLVVTPQPVRYTFKVGDRVEKDTGDCRTFGEVRAAYTTKKGEIRYVVEVEPQGFQMIWRSRELRPAPADSGKPVQRVHDLCMDERAVAGLRAVEARYGD